MERSGLPIYQSYFLSGGERVGMRAKHGSGPLLSLSKLTVSSDADGCALCHSKSLGKLKSLRTYRNV